MRNATVNQLGESGERKSISWRFATFGVGLFVLANGVGETLRPGFSVVGDWLSAARPGLVGAVFSIVLGGVLACHGLLRGLGRLRWPATAVVVAAALVALWDTVRFYRAFFGGNISTPVAVPSTLLVAVALAGVAMTMASEEVPSSSASRRWIALVTAAGVFVALPLVGIFTLGLTRYERQTDVAVVLGARANADGTPSLALADRVDEAVRAYRAGFARRVIMSGGVDPDTGVSEARVMRARAVQAGVPPDVIELDEGGTSTAHTAYNVARLVPGGTRVLLVSHYFHLPRTALLFHRQGLRTFTLPARMSRHLVLEPWFVLREVPAFYVAWLTG